MSIDIDPRTANGEQLLRAYSWHLTRMTGAQVVYGDEILRRLEAAADPKNASSIAIGEVSR